MCKLKLTNLHCNLPTRISFKLLKSLRIGKERSTFIVFDHFSHKKCISNMLYQLANIDIDLLNS